MSRISLDSRSNGFIYQVPSITGGKDYPVKFSFDDLPTFSNKTRELVIDILRQKFDLDDSMSDSEKRTIAVFLQERKQQSPSKEQAKKSLAPLDQLRDDAAGLRKVGAPSLLKNAAVSTLEAAMLTSAFMIPVFDPADPYFEKVDPLRRKSAATAIAVANAAEILMSTWKRYNAAKSTFERYASRMEETLDKERNFLEENCQYLLHRIETLIVNIEKTKVTDSLIATASSERDNCVTARTEIINAVNFHRKLNCRIPITSAEAEINGLFAMVYNRKGGEIVVDGELVREPQEQPAPPRSWICAIQ